MAILCCRVCKSTPIIFISASFVPSNLWLEHHHLTRRVVRPTSLCHQTGRSPIIHRQAAELSLARQCPQPGTNIGGGVPGFSTTDVHRNHSEDVLLLEADGLQLIHARKDLRKCYIRRCFGVQWHWFHLQASTVTQTHVERTFLRSGLLFWKVGSCPPGLGVSVVPRFKLQIFLDEAGAWVDIELYERGIAEGFEAVNLAGLDDENVAGAALEGLAVDGPDAAAFADELDLVVGMTMRARSGAGFAVEEEDGNRGVAVLGADKLMRAADKRQVFLADVMHSHRPR